jgi:hypothetical protein
MPAVHGTARPNALLVALPLLLVLQAPPPDPATLPARDEHQGILVACRPVVEREELHKVLGDRADRAGVLPVELFVRNRGAAPLEVDPAGVFLVIERDGRRHRLEPLAPDQVAQMVLHPQPPEPGVPRPRLPVPLPGRGNRGQAQLARRLEKMAFPRAPIPPGRTASGWVFFAAGTQPAVLRQASLELTRLQWVGSTQPVMFFEIALAPALASTAP